MRRWALELAPEFEKAVRKLDGTEVRRIKKYLEEVCELEDPRSRGKGLTANLSGLWRYRVGDYRMLVEIQDEHLVIVAIEVGHRSHIYRG